MQGNTRLQRGFTLIELSIVLVIIGLIVGGILTGQSLINAAAVRAQVTQIEQFNDAVNTFYGKYGYLPGDINATVAAQFGFTPRGYNGNYAGMGDGNGLIEGTNNQSCGTCNNGVKMPGEPLLLWNDLTWANGLYVNLIPGSFSAASSANSSPPSVVPPAIGAWLPTASIGQNNYVYAWSINGINYFGVSAIYSLNLDIFSNAGMTVSQAYAIDSKIDDGWPQSGHVIAEYIPTSYAAWAMASFQTNGYGGAAPGSAANAWGGSCYDNGNNASNPTHYSIQVSGGAGVNCALSFQMQGAGR
jgi:prepilin-type N-terminal cleavage/methylation domain-containing protein